jgi:hypothetical protein
LAQADGKVLDQGLWVNVEMILRGELAYMLGGLSHVQEWSAPGWFLAEDNILGHGQGRDEHEMLMDHANATCHGVSGAGEMHRGATHDNVSLVWSGKAIEDVHQRGLPRAVFPQQRVDLAGSELKVYMIIGRDPRKTFGDTAHL